MTAGILVAVAGALVIAAAKPAPPPAAPGPTPATPREAFDRGRTAFVRAEYGRAIEILHPLLYPELLLDSEGEIVQAHRMLGVSYLFENKPDDARREFHKLLALRPDYRFDPLLDPQRVVDFFNGVLRDAQAEIAVMEARRRQREQALAARREREAKLSLQPPTVLRYERHSYVVNFIPFGAGQFQNGQPRKGWTFLGVESALAAVSVGAFVTNFALYGVEPRRKCRMMQPPDAGGLPTPCPPDQIDHTEEDRSRLLLRVQVVSGGLFFAVALWGVIDAIRHYQREVRLTDSSPRAVAGDRASSARADGHRRGVDVLTEAFQGACMATLKIQLAGKPAEDLPDPQEAHLAGRSEEADVTLPDLRLADSHAHIHFDGRDFNIATTERDAEVAVNGRKRAKHRLAHEDRIRLGASEIEFSLYDEPVADPRTRRPPTMAELSSYKKLLEFSQR